jgi:hypothetical protein
MHQSEPAFWHLVNRDKRTKRRPDLYLNSMNDVGEGSTVGHSGLSPRRFSPARQTWLVAGFDRQPNDGRGRCDKIRSEMVTCVESSSSLRRSSPRQSKVARHCRRRQTRVGFLVGSIPTKSVRFKRCNSLLKQF